MKKKASIFRSLVLLLLVFVTVSSCCISAMAIGFSGDSFVGTGGVMQAQLSGNYDELPLTSTENMLY